MDKDKHRSKRHDPPSFLAPSLVLAIDKVMRDVDSRVYPI